MYFEPVGYGILMKERNQGVVYSLYNAFQK